LKIRATGDLGALGAKQGPAITYQWSPPSRLPQLLAPLALLLLLFPKRNRSLQVLWIGAPVALSLAVEALVWAMPGVGSDASEGLFEVCAAVAFELGAVWLLSPYLKRRGRFLTFLGMLVTMDLVGALVFMLARQWSDGKVPIEMLIAVALFGLLLSIAINLAAWSCRGRFGWLRLSWWSFVWLMAGCLAACVVMSLTEGRGPWLEMLLAVLVFSAATFALLLPFLVLSFANRFYRERLKEVLRLEDPAPAELEAPAQPAALS
jgi:hypothetical protein